MQFSLRPRFRALAFTSLFVGLFAVIAAAVGLVAPDYRVGCIAAGTVGVLFGTVYLRSPAWRMTIHVSAAGIEVRRPKVLLLDLAWSDVVEIQLGPDRSSLYVDGGSPERSLLIPGPGAPAPYDITDKERLIEEILRNLPESMVDGSDAPAANTPDV